MNKSNPAFAANAPISEKTAGETPAVLLLVVRTQNRPLSCGLRKYCLWAPAVETNQQFVSLDLILDGCIRDAVICYFIVHFAA